MKIRLSEHLKQWRAERPSEYKMDEFIRHSVKMQAAILDLIELCETIPQPATKDGLEIADTIANARGIIIQDF